MSELSNNLTISRSVETAGIDAPEILEASLKSSQHSNDQIKVLDQELIDAKDELNQLGELKPMIYLVHYSIQG